MPAGAAKLSTLALFLGACAGNHQPAHGRPEPSSVASTRPPLPVADAGPARDPDAPIGTARPTVLIAASPAARWVAHCEAREDSDGDGTIAVSIGPHGGLTGDRMQPFLTLSRGDSLPIEQLAAFEPTGRWVVAVLSGRLVLVDASTAAQTDLTALDADARMDAASYRAHRALAFDREGKTLAYLRRTGGSELVIVRDLASGKETAITPAAGSVWRIELEATATWVLLHQVGNAGSGPGWPAPARARLSPCIGPIAPIAASASQPSRATTALAPRSGGVAEPVEGFVAALRAGLVVRESDGRLLLRKSGAETELSPASCGARVVHADVSRDLLVVACTAARGRSPLELVGPGLRQALDLDIAFLGHDRAPVSSPRAIALHPGGAPALLDLDQRRLVRLKTGDFVVVTAGSRALVRRGDRLLVIDVDSNEEKQLEGTTDRIAAVLATEGVAVVAPLVADAEHARLLGKVDAEPLAVARDGRVLVALGGAADADRLAIGPLAWRRPTPIEATDTRR
jgi:hypothetical protein